MNESNKNNQEINLKDLFFYLLSKWRWFLLSVLVCVSLAWYKYACSPFVYFRQATVIIKDPSNKTLSAGLDRYDNYINKVNVGNEILQFRSKNLMRMVVKRVKADVSYIHRDGLRDVELYTKSPVAVAFPEATPEQYLSLRVTPKDKQTVEVTDLSYADNSKVWRVKLNQKVKVNGVQMVISPTDYYSEAWMGKDIKVGKMPLTSMAAYYLGNLGIRQEQDEASILTLSLKDSSPARAEDVLNMLITVYNEEALNDKNQVAVNTADFINERLIIISNELGGVET